jgi:hypothetical protein
MLFCLMAMKQETGCRENATSTSLAQASLKFCRTQATILCFSGAIARRVVMAALPRRSKHVAGGGQRVQLDQHVHGRQLP